MASTREGGGMRYTICVDFDGVIHNDEVSSIIPHIILGPPVKGAIPWLHLMVQHFDIVICSLRCRTWRGQRAMRRWLRKHSDFMWDGLVVQNGAVPGILAYRTDPRYPGTLTPVIPRKGLSAVRFSYVKVPALIYFDDRAVRFEGPGTFPTKDAIHQQYIPWNKSQHATRLSARGPVL